MKKIISIFAFTLMMSLHAFSQDSIITTLQPVITLDTNAVCVGSTISVPFYSVGLYTSGNIYSAVLSNAAGNFINNTSIIGTMSNTLTYDPNLGSLPGTVSGVVPDVADGCNYYIRITASAPATIGAVYGPFCIQHCDININNGQNIHLCLTPTTTAIDTSVNIQIHTWTTNQTYISGNQFEAELLDTTTFNPVGAIGALGTVTATHDTILTLTIPPLVSLQSMSIYPGSYYFRVIASDVQYSDSSRSSLIRFTIGAPADNAPSTTVINYSTFTQLTSDTICNSENIYFEPNPFNSNSGYTWTSAQLQGSPLNQQTMDVLFTGFVGYFIWTLQEINFGCPGPVSVPDTLVVLNSLNCSLTGINESSNYKNEIILYPNPNNGIFTFKGDFRYSIYDLRIIDVLGSEVYHQAITNSNNQTIDISNISNGFYFYLVRWERGEVRGKIVKQ